MARHHVDGRGARVVHSRCSFRRSTRGLIRIFKNSSMLRVVNIEANKPNTSCTRLVHEVLKNGHKGRPFIWPVSRQRVFISIQQTAHRQSTRINLRCEDARSAGNYRFKNVRAREGASVTNSTLNLLWTKDNITVFWN